jgi:serine protease Do
MRVGWSLAAILVCVFCVSGSTAFGERIVLKSGQEIKAAILKQDSKNVVVDLGSSVATLAKADIEKIEPDHAASGPSTGPATSQPTTGSVRAVEAAVPKMQLYRTAKLSATTIEKNADHFGEAVVMVNSPGGQGSGFLINEDGYLVTNYHVIARETALTVTVFHKADTGFEQKRYKNVKIIAINPFVDLALLKIEAPDVKFKYVYLGDMKDLAAGQDCFAIGNPMGLTRTVSQGIISTTNRNDEGQLYIQTTTLINPGNSGGPLLSFTGEVIGVTSMGYRYLAGLNFAIPIDVVKRFLDNRDAFAYDEENANTGYRYLSAPTRADKGVAPAGLLPIVDEQADVPAGKAQSMPASSTTKALAGK